MLYPLCHRVCISICILFTFMSVSSLTYCNDLPLGFFLTMYKDLSNETWYILTSAYDHLKACTVCDLDLLVMIC